MSALSVSHLTDIGSRWLPGDAYLLNSDDGQPAARLSHDGDVNALAFSPDGRFLATGSSDHTVRIWLVVDGTEIARLPHPDSLFVLTFDGDGQRLARATWDRVVRIWRWRPEDPIS